MNSSANQTSPITIAAKYRRAWLIFPNRQVLPEALESPYRTGRLRREYAVNGPVYARRKAGHSAAPMQPEFALSPIAGRR